MSQKNDYTWTYNGNDYELDMGDYETAKRFENAVDVMANREKEISKEVNLSDSIRLHCEAYYEFFDSIFGEGAAEKIFEGKRNMRLCSEVYFNKFIPFIRNQSVQFRNYANQFTKNPQNRAQRRQNKPNKHWSR